MSAIDDIRQKLCELERRVGHQRRAIRRMWRPTDIERIRDALKEAGLLGLKARFLGPCDQCGEPGLYCCYSSSSGADSATDHFTHFCASGCGKTDEESQHQRESFDMATEGGGLEAATCPFCGYNWSSAYNDPTC